MKKRLKRDLKQSRAKPTNKWRPACWVLLLAALAAGGWQVYRLWDTQQPQKLLKEAVKLESRGQSAASAELYQRLSANYPDSPQAARALLRLARQQLFEKDDHQRALLYLLQLEHDYPASPLVLQAREQAAELIKRYQRDYQRAIDYYQRLLQMDGGTADRYLYEIADCYFRLENYPQARVELENLLDRYPDSPLAPAALYRRGGILLLEERAAEAEEVWEELIQSYPNNAYQSRAEFNLAKLLEEREQLEEALQRYRTLDDFPHPALLEKTIKHLEQRLANKQRSI